VTFIAKSKKEAQNGAIRVACREHFGKPGPAAVRGFSMSFSRGLPDRQASVLDRMGSALSLALA
jgi:hypothetical protein